MIHLLYSLPSLTRHTQLQERNGGKASPEFRIPGMILGSILVPIGLL